MVYLMKRNKCHVFSAVGSANRKISYVRKDLKVFNKLLGHRPMTGQERKAST